MAARDGAHTFSYRLGSYAALAIGIAYLATIVLFAIVGAPPSGAQDALEYFNGKTAAWWAILGLSVVTDLLYIPVALALYDALRDTARSLMLIAVALVGAFVVLDQAVTWSNYAALLTLSADYSATANAAQRAADVAAAAYASAVLASPLERVYSIVILSTGILIIGGVMLRGAFGRVTAYLAIATSLLGIASIAGLTATIILNALGATVWVFFVSYRLYRLGARRGQPSAEPA